MPNTKKPPQGFDFRPLPLLSNPHLQTLIGHMWPGPTWSNPTCRQLLHLPDGDTLSLYDTTPAGWQPGDPIALFVHGLTGANDSPQVLRVANIVQQHGWRVVRIDQRGAGPSVSLARRSYNAAASGDVRAALEEVHKWSPTSPLTAVGFSLGGNVVLKMAGEAAEHPIPGLARVAALAPPIDCERCADLIGQSHNRLYDTYFVRRLVREAQQRQRHFPDLPPLRFPQRMNIRLFDDLYTAPRSGFADALDYYRKAAAFPLVPRIQLPTFILTAHDDPFIAVEPFLNLQLPSHIELRIVPHGGHLGFLGWDGAGGVRWVERRLAEWIVSGHD